MKSRRRRRTWGVSLLVAMACASVPAEAPAQLEYPPAKNRAYIRDLEYIHRTYFFLADHPVRIDRSSLRVLRDDLIPSNDPAQGSVRGLARLDPTVPSDEVINPQRQGSFFWLEPGVDFELITLWNPAAIWGPIADGLEIPVVKLARQLAVTDVIAVSYTDLTSGAPVRIGASTPEEFFAADTVLGKPANAYLLKTIKPSQNDILPNWMGDYDPQSPWYPALFYELRNLYDLTFRNIPRDRFRLAIRKVDSGSATDPSEAGGEPYLEMLGLDQRGPSGSSDSTLSDGLVDDEFIDYEGGLLYFPDLHPFAPDSVDTNCPPDRAGFLCLDDLERNRLRFHAPDYGLQSNPTTYYRRNVDPVVDTRFYLDVAILPPPDPGGALDQNVPNPFNPETRIPFRLNYDADARVAVYDIRGRLVQTLLDGNLPRGPHTVSWSGTDRFGRAVASGIYICVLETAGKTYSRRMALIR